MVTKKQLESLYQKFLSDSPYLDKTVKVISGSLYPDVVCRCTYEYVGKRHFKSGGTPALQQAMSAFSDFVIAYESGDVTMLDIDSVLWACHNNGTFADVFISDVSSEFEAVEFLNRLGGIVR